MQQPFKPYRFIFLDSVNALGLSAEDMKKIYDKYPTKSFISVLKGTKSGDFRGSLEYEHDVDVSIKCVNGVVTLNKFFHAIF